MPHTDSFRRHAVLAGILALVASALALPAMAHPRHPYSMEVRVDGVPLRAHHARGKTYVEALEDREYAIRLSNQTDRRVAVALAVDGLNSIDAKTTTARDAAKWILAPYQTITIRGWQTGAATARRFYFTDEQDSYGAWLGKTRNLGVISAAFFPERIPQPILFDESREHKGGSSGEAGAAPPPSQGPSGRQKRVENESLSDDHAATGIGREVDHRVRRVQFDAEDTPAASIELRYEYRDTLISLGVLPRWTEREQPLTRREQARGFEGFEFAPAPPR